MELDNLVRSSPWYFSLDGLTESWKCQRGWHSICNAQLRVMVRRLSLERQVCTFGIVNCWRSLQFKCFMRRPLIARFTASCYGGQFVPILN